MRLVGLAWMCACMVMTVVPVGSRELVWEEGVYVHMYMCACILHVCCVRIHIYMYVYHVYFMCFR